MKRYKQTILSNFFVTSDDSGIHHLVEANLDIESRSDLTLCTDVLQGIRRYEVLTQQNLPGICMICSAILDRRISNMPKERKTTRSKPEFELCVPDSQLCLLTDTRCIDSGDPSCETSEQQPGQFQLLL